MYKRKPNKNGATYKNKKKEIQKNQDIHNETS